MLRMTDATPRPAHLGWRLAAAIYDLFPLIAIWMVTGTAAMIATHGTLDYHAPWYRLLLLGVTAAYYVPSWHYGGQTIGMRAWRLRFQPRDNAGEIECHVRHHMLSLA